MPYPSRYVQGKRQSALTRTKPSAIDLLDEAGISAGESHLCVAGVIVHGDHEALAVENSMKLLNVTSLSRTARIHFSCD